MCGHAITSPTSFQRRLVCVWLTTAFFAICVRSPSPLLAGRHVVSAQFVGDANGCCFFVRSAFAYTVVSKCCLLASSLCPVKAGFCLWFRLLVCHRSCNRPKSVLGVAGPVIPPVVCAMTLFALFWACFGCPFITVHSARTGLKISYSCCIVSLMPHATFSTVAVADLPYGRYRHLVWSLPFACWYERSSAVMFGFVLSPLLVGLASSYTVLYDRFSVVVSLLSVFTVWLLTHGFAGFGCLFASYVFVT